MPSTQVKRIQQALQDGEIERISYSTAQQRFEATCRSVYNITRDILNDEDFTAGHHMEKAYMGLDSSDPHWEAISALVLDNIRNYLDLKQQQDKDLFKTEFIKALDLTVQECSHAIEAIYDTRTEQSTEGSPSQSPKTP